MRVLVVDSDPQFLNQLKKDPLAKRNPPSLARSSHEAQGHLINTKGFSGIFVNPIAAFPNGLSVIRSAHLHHLGTPIFLLCDGKRVPLREEDLKKLALQEVVHKPISYSEMVKLVEPMIQSFDARGVLTESQKNEDRINEESQATSSEFVPVRSENFISGQKSLFDVYVKLPNKKFLKLLQAGDPFSPDRLENYLKKGVVNFYIKREIQKGYLSYCDHLSRVILKSEKVPLSLKISQTLNLGEEVQSFLKLNGVVSDQLQYAGNFVQNLCTIVEGVQFSSHKLVQQFLKDLIAYDHGVSVAMIAVLITRSSQFDSQLFQQNVGLASLFHDIGLLGESENIRNEEFEKMSKVEKQIFFEHSVKGAKALEKMGGIHPSIVQAVAQHHERRDGKGFPRGLGPGAISPIAEVVGMSDVFFRFIRQAKSDPYMDPVREMELISFNGFSYPVINGFRDAFLTEKS